MPALFAASDLVNQIMAQVSVHVSVDVSYAALIGNPPINSGPPTEYHKVTLCVTVNLAADDRNGSLTSRNRRASI